MYMLLALNSEDTFDGRPRSGRVLETSAISLEHVIPPHYHSRARLGLLGALQRHCMQGSTRTEMPHAQKR